MRDELFDRFEALDIDNLCQEASGRQWSLAWQRDQQRTWPVERLMLPDMGMEPLFDSSDAADITGVWTMEGWLYLAVVLDIFSRMVVGWAMDAHREAVLVENALQMALARRHPEPGLLHHSDRGSQYTCQDYQALLARSGSIVSMSRKGDCYDNALMESFNGTLKTECVEPESYQTRSQARQSIFEYLEAFYNRQRLHSSLGYVSPVVYEQHVR